MAAVMTEMLKKNLLSLMLKLFAIEVLAQVDSS